MELEEFVALYQEADLDGYKGAYRDMREIYEKIKKEGLTDSLTNTRARLYIDAYRQGLESGRMEGLDRESRVMGIFSR